MKNEIEEITLNSNVYDFSINHGVIDIKAIFKIHD